MTGLAVAALAVGIGGCGSAHGPAAPSVPSQESVAGTPAPLSSGNPCADAEFKSRQFTGDWTEAGTTIVQTLDTDGTLRSHWGGEDRSGTWSYTPWELTPGKVRMPAGEADRCVLWLHWNDPAADDDLVYVPLKVTADSLTLSYVYRGNTLTWVRPNSGG